MAPEIIEAFALGSGRRASWSGCAGSRRCSTATSVVAGADRLRAVNKPSWGGR